MVLGRGAAKVRAMRSIVLCLACAAALVHAAVGPETTAVIINGDSADSRALAAAWMEVRGIPAGQAITLSGIPAGQRCSLEDFQATILDPVEATLRERGLAERTLVIAYAGDFPTAIDLPDTEGLQRWQRGPASLTGLTLLAPLISGGRAAITQPMANPYAEVIADPTAASDRLAAADPRLKTAFETMAEKPAEAEAILAALAADFPGTPGLEYNLACVRARLGRLDEAEASLTLALAAGFANAAHLDLDPDLRPLHARPAWADLRARALALGQAIRPHPSIGFTQRPASNGSVPGRLAMLLAPLRGRGLDVETAIAGLRRSAAADGSRPAGTVVICNSRDEARSATRRWAFAGAAETLCQLGVAAEVRVGAMPSADSPCIGVLMGVATFDWPASGATILPGAWCDHLTSFGGDLRETAGQTPLTAFLTAGAAGAGGTVSEPLNVAFKFPSAFVHVHRVRGLSLVEAVHRTIASPYQYLCVGDPLSRPWPKPALPAPIAGDAAETGNTPTGP